LHYQPDTGILTLDTLSGVVEQRLPALTSPGRCTKCPARITSSPRKSGGEAAFRNSDEKHDNSIRYVLGLGCVDAMVVGFEKVEEIDDFAARVRKVSPALIKKA